MMFSALDYPVIGFCLVLTHQNYDEINFYCHGTVDSSASTILPPRVRVPSTSAMLLSFIVKIELYLSWEKNENKQK